MRVSVFRTIQALSYCKHPQSASKATCCPVLRWKMDFQEHAVKRESLAYGKKASRQLQVIWRVKASFVEGQKGLKPCKWLILSCIAWLRKQNSQRIRFTFSPCQGECLLGQMPFLIACLQCSKYLPLSYSDNAKEHSQSHEKRRVWQRLKGSRWKRAWPWKGSPATSVW